MTTFDPWALFVDAGIISALLLVGKLLRAKVKIVQQLFIPPSLMAGFLGLAFGPEGLDVLPLSSNLGTYASILIALVFSCLPFSSAKSDNSRTNIVKMWAYSQMGMFGEWAFGGLVGIFVLAYVWHTHPAFGLSMPAGYCGGHGTAAAIGTAFANIGYDDMMSLAMTSATVGILAAVFVGLALIKWGTSTGKARFVKDFSQLPHELRTGLLPKDKRESIGEATCSSISIDPLAFNVAILIVVALGGYGISQLVSHYVSGLQMPVFSCAFVFGILFKLMLQKTNAYEYVCPKTVSHFSGMFTDYLVACGISAIKIDVILRYWLPLTLLLAVSLVVVLIYVIFFAKRIMKQEYWFEKSLFTWGWFTGTMATGIALLRVVDPEMKSKCLDDYALAYLFIAPVEISLITFAPVAFAGGWLLEFVLTALVAGLAIFAFIWAKGWLKPEAKEK